MHLNFLIVSSDIVLDHKCCINEVLGAIKSGRWPEFNWALLANKWQLDEHRMQGSAGLLPNLVLLLGKTNSSFMFWCDQKFIVVFYLASIYLLVISAKSRTIQSRKSGPKKTELGHQIW